MDLQKLVDAMGDACRRERANYHVTLGALIAELEKADPDDWVIISAPGDALHGLSIDAPGSYRGFYSDLAFEPSTKTATVGGVLDHARRALGATFEGYKGGDFVMGADTPLWVSTYGSASGVAIIAGYSEPGTFTLVTKRID